VDWITRCGDIAIRNFASERSVVGRSSTYYILTLISYSSSLRLDFGRSARGVKKWHFEDHLAVKCITFGGSQQKLVGNAACVYVYLGIPFPAVR